MKHIVIVGGGITGLAAASRWKRRGDGSGTAVRIQLLEGCARLGGPVPTPRRDGSLLEGGPDCFLSEKPRAAELCRELGLAGQLLNTQSENRRSFIVREGKLHPVPEGFYLIAPSKLRPFLASPLLSWRGKWRVLAEALLPSHPQTDESLASFVRRRLGQEALDWLAQPLFAGIYAADPETLSLGASFPHFLPIAEKEGGVLPGLKHRDLATQEASGARYSLFVTLRNGMQILVDRLTQALAPDVIQLNSIVTAR